MIGGKQTCGPSPGERDQKTRRKSEGFLSKWSWSDDFSVFFFDFLAAGVVPTVVRTHVVPITVCATGSVHTLTCCTYIFWCTYTARTLRTFLCVLHTGMAQGCLQCACHVSLDSPSHFSCFTRLCLCLPCCSLTVTSRPLPTATLLTLTSTTSRIMFPT